MSFQTKNDQRSRRFEFDRSCLTYVFHSLLFFRRFNLIDPKETEVLHDLEVALRLTEDSTTNPTTTTTSSSSTGGGDLTTTTTNTTTTTTSVTGTVIGVDGAGGVGAGGTGVMVDNGSVGQAATVNQTGAIKCKSSISCGGDHHQHHHHNHHTGEGCGSGCTESIMYTGALDQRPPIVNQPERGE